MLLKCQKPLCEENYETGTQTFSVFEILDHTPVVRVRLVTIVCIKRQIAAAVVQNGNSSRKA
jgi:hypothetical protein